MLFGVFAEIVHAKHTDFILSKLRQKTGNYVLMGAHRGDWRNAPENSLQAIQRCIDMGLDIVEIDLRKTKDGHLIIMHDKTLDRTTTGKGKVSEHTLEEIKQLYLKSPIGIETRERVPTLQEALATTKGRILVFLDKAEHYIPELTPVLDSMGMCNEVILFGREQLSYEEQKKVYGELVHKTIFIPVLKGDMKDIPAYINDMHEHIQPAAYAFEFNEEDTAVLRYIQQVERLGAKPWISTLWRSLCGGHDDDSSVSNPEYGWGWILAHHAKVILTDRPAELKGYLQKKKHRTKK